MPMDSIADTASGTAQLRGLRADFPVLSRTLDGTPLVYLDSAATSLKPTAVIDETMRYYRSVGANIHRGKHMLSEEASAHYEGVRYRVAEFVGCRGDEVVFVRNTTEAINIVATGLRLAPDDLTLSPLDTHHSLLLPWLRACRVELVRTDPVHGVDRGHLAELLRRRPRVVALSACSNVSGIYPPIRELVAMAKAAGATVIVDAAQSVPHRRIRFDDLGADFLAFSGHKMLGPTGIGVLAGRSERLADLLPAMVGGGTVDRVAVDRFDPRKVPHRFEAGTPHIAGVYGLGAAIDYLERIGFDVLAEHDRQLSHAMWREVRRREQLVTVAGGEDADRAAIMSLSVAGLRNLGDVARVLSDSYGVMCRSGHLCSQPLVDHLYDGQVLRLSAYVYNTLDEVVDAFAALDEVLARVRPARTRR
jgi:cysteine desulfurase / selenocysteine lyase